MVKKLAKAIDEIAKNEELMEGIMAAAEDEGRLVTIGEEDDKQGATQNTNKHQVFRDDEEEDEYI